MNLNERDQKEVDSIKSRLKVLGPKIQGLQQYTRPLGKSQVPFEIAKILEDRHAAYSDEFGKLSARLKRIYKRNGMRYL